MTRRTVTNEKKIVEFLNFGLSEMSKATKNSHEKSIELFQEFYNYGDFKNFTRNDAINFIKKLKYAGYSTSTINTHPRNLKKFLLWLSREAGYKSRISINDVQCLKLTLKENRSISKNINTEYPTYEQIKALFNSIKVKNEIDRRDKALIAFLAATGIRVEAAITLTIQAVDIENMIVYQSNQNGVKTKFGKSIITKIFNYDNEMTKYFVEWYKFLKEEKLFGNEFPVFPRSRQKQDKIHTAFSYEEIDNKKWESTNSVNEILKNRAVAANLKYFSPHKFRHAAVYMACKKSNYGEAIKAISQNFGHEHMETTIGVYGNLPPERLIEVLGEIDKSSNDDTLSKEDIKALSKLARTLTTEDK